MCSSVPSVSKPGKSGDRQPAAGRVEPQRRRAGEDPDAVHRPDRVPVLDALGVVPHPVGVDHARRRPSAVICDHPAVDVGGHAGDHVRRAACPSRVGPVLADQVVVAADAAGGDDHRRRAQLEVADLVAVLDCAARARVVGSSTVPRTPIDGAVRRRSARRPGGGSEGRRGRARGGLARRRANGSTTPGPVPHVMWKRGTELPCPIGAVAAALGPADDREEAHALLAAARRASRPRRSRRRPRPTGAASGPRAGRTPPCRASPAARARASP